MELCCNLARSRRGGSKRQREEEEEEGGEEGGQWPPEQSRGTGDAALTRAEWMVVGTERGEMGPMEAKEKIIKR